MDDSTADVFSTYLTPRRPEDARNLRPGWSSSALDHRQRFTDTVIYQMPFDSAGDRVFVNPKGQPNVGSGTTALKNSAGQTVAYLVNNPNAASQPRPQHRTSEPDWRRRS